MNRPRPDIMDVLDIWRHILAVEPLVAALMVTLCKDISSLVDVSAKYDYMIAIGYTVDFAKNLQVVGAHPTELVWLRNGKKHRTVGPTYSFTCGCKIYFQRGTLISCDNSTCGKII